MAISLRDILEEIQVGAKQNDPASIRLKQKQDKIRVILSKQGAVLENKTIELLSSNIFTQGSYATDTAIKHKLYDVDADLGIIFPGNQSLKIRERIYQTLDRELKKEKAVVTFKKPCIEIDFKDGYCVDVAVYSGNEPILDFYNNIRSTENKQQSSPKKFVDYLKEKLSEDTRKRKIIRLLKHFNNVSYEKLDISEENKIPSISITLFILSETIKSNNLDDMVLEGISKFREFVYQNEYIGPSISQFYIGNTFYKVKDINQVKKTLDLMFDHITNQHYTELVSKGVYESISKRKNIKVDKQIIGTLGNE